MSIELDATDGIGEIEPGTDLAREICRVHALYDGDVVVVTSKVVSKAEGRLSTGSREDALAGETVRVVARRGSLQIVENRLGLVMAAAGVDNSNVAAGTVALLPNDPDDSARRIRAGVREITGRNVAVVISDTSGRTWRLGQTDIAIGAAGLAPLESFAGRVDGYGNPLAVTEPAIADEIAGAAELAAGKLGRHPVVVVRGLADRVLPVGEDGPGARSVVRPRSEDLFSLGVRESVVAAVAGDDPAAFGTPAPVEELIAALVRCRLDPQEDDDAITLRAVDPADLVRARLIAHAHGWSATGSPSGGTDTGTSTSTSTAKHTVDLRLHAAATGT